VQALLTRADKHVLVLTPV